MVHLNRTIHLLVIAVFIASVIFTAAPAQPVAAASSTIVISQVYGWGGGGPGRSYYGHDYVELFNAGTSLVDITGWSLQWSQFQQGIWDNNKTVLSGSIAPGHYFLVEESDVNPLGTSGGDHELPVTPDQISTVAIGNLNGVVALTNTPDSLVGIAPDMTHVVDLVSYEATTAPEDIVLPSWNPILTAGSYQVIYARKNGGCTNTQSNAADFTKAQIVMAKQPAGNPGPRNSLSTPNFCKMINWPKVVATSPTNNKMRVSTTPTIKIIFNHAVTATSSSFALVCNGAPIPYTLGGGPRVYTLKPISALELKSLCTVTVDHLQIVDAAKNSPRADYIFRFSTSVRPTNLRLTKKFFYYLSPPGTLIGNFIVTDAALPPETFTFQLVTGRGSIDNAKFMIVSNGLATNADFSSATRIVYRVRVRVTDSIGLTYEKPLLVFLSKRPVP